MKTYHPKPANTCFLNTYTRKCSSHPSSNMLFVPEDGDHPRNIQLGCMQRIDYGVGGNQLQMTHLELTPIPQAWKTSQKKGQKDCKRYRASLLQDWVFYI